MPWWSEPRIPPAERERARELLTAREYDAWRMRHAGYSVMATARCLGIGQDAARGALKRANKRLGSDEIRPMQR